MPSRRWKPQPQPPLLLPHTLVVDSFQHAAHASLRGSAEVQEEGREEGLLQVPALLLVPLGEGHSPPLAATGEEEAEEEGQG